RVEPPRAAEGGDPHAGRGPSARRPAGVPSLGRRRAPDHSAGRAPVHLVELPLARLAGVRPRPPARPRLDHALARRALARRRGAACGAQLAAALGPRPRDDHTRYGLMPPATPLSAPDDSRPAR